MPRRRLSVEEKTRRGTLRPSREAARGNIRECPIFKHDLAKAERLMGTNPTFMEIYKGLLLLMEEVLPHGGTTPDAIRHGVPRDPADMERLEYLEEMVGELLVEFECSDAVCEALYLNFSELCRQILVQEAHSNGDIPDAYVEKNLAENCYCLKPECSACWGTGLPEDDDV